MNTKTFSASCMKEDARVALGRQMENNYRAITFDLSGFGVEVVRAMIVHQRKLDTAPYIVTSVTGQDSITWTVTNTDTAFAGSGEAEIRIEFADGLAKTVVFQTVVIPSITADTEIPEPLQSWYDAMIDYIDDHSVSPEQIEQAVADYLDEHPVQAPVTSVNSKIGAVVLNADDVGALPDTTTAADLGAYVKPNTGIPKTDLSTAVQASLNKADTALQSAPVTSVNTKTGAVVLTAADVGAYVKPSGGIPKSDLTASVQTSLNKADTALQSAPVTSVNSKTGAVTLNASDVGAMPSSYVAPVTSVDGKTGAVQIMPSGGSVGQVLTKTSSGTAWQTVSGGGAVDSVNGQTGVVVLDANDVGALPDTTVIPTKTSDLTNDSGFITSADDVFWCTYGTTTSAEIEAALTAGKIPMVKYQDYIYTLRYRNSATNHRFVCNYGGKEKSIACQSGTWIPNGDLTFLTTSYTAPVTSVNGSTGAVVIGNATTSAAGLMSATDKSHLDDVYADYSSALTALGVI